MDKAEAFKKAIEFTFKWEGVLSDDKDDPGGLTKYGITLGALKEAGKDLNHDGVVDLQDIREVDIAIAVQIYKSNYWNSCGCDNLPWALGIAAFDTAVNCGVTRVLRWLKETEGKKYYALLNMRNTHYLTIIKKNPKLAKFKNGWFNRVNDLSKYITILERELESST